MSGAKPRNSFWMVSEDGRLLKSNSTEVREEDSRLEKWRQQHTFENRDGY